MTYIGRSAFEHCDGLVSVSLSDGLIGIDMNAFLLCPSLASITIPESVTEIGEGAFEACSGLTSITIPTGVTDIGVSAFYNTAYYKDESNWTDGMMYIGPALIACKEDKVGAVTIKDGTTCIADYAVAGTYRYGMISGCPGLTSIIIPDSVISIGECAFSGCTGLTSIMVAAGNTIYHATGNCLIETAGKTLIAGCKNSVIPTDGSVTIIGEYAFFYCTGLTTITIPVSVTGVGAEAFKGTAYYNTESNWVDDVLYIDAVLVDCRADKKNTVSVKPGTVCIADEAFSRCAELRGVTLPSSVKTIGELAFNVCSSLKDITYRGQKEQWKKVTRGERWNSNSGIKTINCSDGKIELGA